MWNPLLRILRRQWRHEHSDLLLISDTSEFVTKIMGHQGMCRAYYTGLEPKKALAFFLLPPWSDFPFSLLLPAHLSSTVSLLPELFSHFLNGVPRYHKHIIHVLGQHVAGITNVDGSFWCKIKLLQLRQHLIA